MSEDVLWNRRRHHAGCDGEKNYQSERAVEDAREGRALYFWSIFQNPAQRREILRDGWKDIGRVFLIAVVIDFIYQIIVLRWFLSVTGPDCGVGSGYFPVSNFPRFIEPVRATLTSSWGHPRSSLKVATTGLSGTDCVSAS